jgi:hypothetical protein
MSITALPFAVPGQGSSTWHVQRRPFFLQNAWHSELSLSMTFPSSSTEQLYLQLQGCADVSLFEIGTSARLQ